MLIINDLIERANSQDYTFPVEANRIDRITGPPLDYSPAEIERQAARVRPIIHPSVLQLAKDFLEFRRHSGSAIEQEFYKHLSLEAFLDKLLCKRPLMFMGERDLYLLRDGKTRDRGGFEDIGTDKERLPLVLSAYNSYPEMQIAAMIGVSVPTFFINNGNRFNEGIPDPAKDFETSGIYTGLVGARFEREGLMEWQHLVITPQQNTSENGYGPHADPEQWETRALEFWAKFYGEGDGNRHFFPDYETAMNDTTGNFIPFPSSISWSENYFLNRRAYKHRIRMIAEPFLMDASDRAKAEGKQAYVIAVGFGIGVWALDEIKEVQAEIIIEAFADCIAQCEMPGISDLCFSWYPSSCTYCGNAADGEILEMNGNYIRIHFNKNNPIEKLTGEHAGKLLVASYAWDGNSYPGNEYWVGNLSASGDPAAACCSTISELQNPDVNPTVSGGNVWVSGT